MQETVHRYFALHKPYNMVSQFISSHSVNLLGNINYNFPEGTHAIGRLDNNSEGLLLLTTNKKITNLLFKSSTPHLRTYLVQVDYIVKTETLEKLRNGVDIKIRGNCNWKTSPCQVQIVEPSAQFNITNKYGTHTWLEITLTEGKYHQIRKMVFATGHRCKRLIRTSIENIELGTLKSGEVREINEQDFFSLLKI